MKNIKLFQTFVLILASLMTASAQDTAPDSSWTVDGYGSATLNQVSFTNWAQGGDNSVSFTLIGLMNAKYAKERHHWDNYASLLIGVIRTKEFGVRKNDDKLELETKYGYDLNNKKTVSLSLLSNFRSQFANGYNYPDDSTVISKFAAPGYLTLALGIDWKPVSYFSLFISPVTGRVLLVTDPDIANTGIYGNDAAVYDSIGNIVTEGDKVRFDFGALVSAKLNKEVIKNVTVVSKFDLFSNYLGDTKESRMVDVNWETGVLFKVNDWLAASLSLTLLYDKEIKIAKDDNDNGTIEADEIKDRVQFKEALGVGLSYKFNNNKRTGREK